MTRSLALKYGPRLAAVSAGVLSLAARADAGADAVTAITAAQTSALLVCGGLVALVIAVWGALYIKGFFGKK